MDGELREIEAATRDVLTAVHTVADRVQPPENARATLLGVGAVLRQKDRRQSGERRRPGGAPRANARHRQTTHFEPSGG